MVGSALGPSLTVDAVFVRGDRILLVRRGRPPFRGRWALPGGFVEADETVEQAVVRELREETGLRAMPSRLLGVYSGPDRDPRRPTASVVFLMAGPGGDPVGGDDAGEAAWKPLARARGLAFDHDRIVADARRARAALPLSSRAAAGAPPRARTRRGGRGAPRRRSPRGGSARSPRAR
ncbi:MAG TPA: NUDIX hydrolase [Thermoplasmata archaeon]|nr:NUDIX hydrolase [Thermoplasmata archaeon]